MDIWVNATPENTRRAWRALVRFGAPLHDLSIDELAQPNMVYQMGVEPLRIDIMTSISGVDFDAAWKDRPHFHQNKLASGRPKDLGDVDELDRYGDGTK